MNPNKSYKAMVSVPLEIQLIGEVDSLAAEQQVSRACYIRNAVKEKVARDRGANYV